MPDNLYIFLNINNRPFNIVKHAVFATECSFAPKCEHKDAVLMVLLKYTNACEYIVNFVFVYGAIKLLSNFFLCARSHRVVVIISNYSTCYIVAIFPQLHNNTLYCMMRSKLRLRSRSQVRIDFRYTLIDIGTNRAERDRR